MKGRPISGAAAARSLARWTFRRHLRGRSLWVAGFFALVPLLPLIIGDVSPEHDWEPFLRACVLVLALVGALLSAPAIAEEVEEQTFTYLWSRPFPRWAVLVGKLSAGVPLSAAMVAVTAAIGYGLLGGSDAAQLFRGIGALAVGAVGVGVVAAGLGSLVPRQALGVAIGYFLVLDIPVGALPFSLAKLSVTHQAARFAGLEDGSMAGALVWMAGIALFWLVLGALRLARAEYGAR